MKKRLISLFVILAMVFALVPFTTVSTKAIDIKVKVSFDMQGHGTQPDAQSVAVGGKVKTPDDPSATGYKFGGWYKEAACDTEWDFDNDTVSVDTTIFAKWEAKTTSVTLDQNNGTAGSKTSVTATYGSAMPELTAAGQLPTYTEYIFTGYFDLATGGTKYYNDDGTSAKNWDKDAETSTLYAQWSSTGLITYDSDGGTTVQSETVQPGTCAMKPTDPTKFGYKFAGWLYNDQGNLVNFDFTTPITRNYTLIASWTEIKILEGKDQSVDMTKAESATFRTSEEFSTFQKVLVDDKEVDAKYYDKKEGSTIITLKKEFLTTLSNGTHTISIVASTGTTGCSFTISGNTPNTGDEGIGLWIAALVIAAFSAVVLLRRRTVK